MPLTHLACPEYSPTYGEAHTPDFCMSRCENRCLSPYLLAALFSSERRNHHKGKLISVTSLSSDGCPRSLLLERTVPYTEDPLKMLYAFRGTLAHQVIEEAVGFKFSSGRSLEDYGFLTEYRMLMCFCFLHGGFPAPPEADEYDPDTWGHVHCPTCVTEGTEGQSDWFFLSGTCDGAEPLWGELKDGVLPVVLFDNKTAQEYAVDAVISGDAKKDSKYGAAVKDGYVEQLSSYKYLLENIAIPEPLQRIAEQRGLPPITKLRVVDARIQFITMGKFPLTGGAYMHRKHWKHDFTKFYVPPIPIMDDEWCENHIRVNGWPVYQALIKEEGRGQICAPADNKKGAHHWKCGTRSEPGFCAFAFTEKCPNPKKEWELLQAGATPEEAFQGALAAMDEPDPEPEEKPKKAKKEPAKKATKKKADKLPTLDVEREKANILEMPATLGKRVKELEEKGLQIHEELVPKRQAVVVTPNGEVVDIKPFTRKQIDFLVEKGWLRGNPCTDNSFVRWEVK